MRHLSIFSANLGNGSRVRFGCWFNDDGTLDSTTEAWLTERECPDNVRSIEEVVKPYLSLRNPVVFDWTAPNGTVRRCVLSPNEYEWVPPTGRDTPVGIILQ